MKKFREKEVIGWETISEDNEQEYDNHINSLMNRYYFEDYQFSTCINDHGRIIYSGSMLLKKKEE